MSKPPLSERVSVDGFAPKPDGRRLRGARTKQRIVEAFLELLTEGTPNPRLSDVAKRAGYATRSIHERFVSIDELRVAAAEQAMNQAIAPAPLAQADADRQTRINAQVHTCAGTCERALPIWRLLVAGQSSSPGLRDRVTVVRKMISLRLEAMYAPELATLPAPERRRVLVTLETLTDFESWGLMREHYEMSFDEACDIWVGAIDRLLPSAPGASNRPHP